MGFDPNTPRWVQHIAFKVKDRDELIAFKDHLEKNGVEVLGVTDHSIFHSIYFFDPNGHRVELACPDPEEDQLLARLDEVKCRCWKNGRRPKGPRNTLNGCTPKSWPMCEQDTCRQCGKCRSIDAALADLGGEPDVSDLSISAIQLSQSEEQQTGTVKRHKVVVIGAGPIGLTAALDFAQRGIPTVVLDDNNTVSIGSRAVCYAKRPLEIWDRLAAPHA